MSSFSDFITKTFPHALGAAGEWVGRFFVHLFGTSAKAAQEVLEETSAIATAALPYIKDIATVASSFTDSNDAAKAIVSFLPNVVKDVEAVKAFADANTGTPINNLLHNAVVFLLAHSAGYLSIPLHVLDLAAQLGYNLYKKQLTA